MSLLCADWITNFYSDPKLVVNKQNLVNSLKGKGFRKSYTKWGKINKNTKCPIDAHCHRHCRKDQRIAKYWEVLQVFF